MNVLIRDIHIIASELELNLEDYLRSKGLPALEAMDYRQLNVLKTDLIELKLQFYNAPKKPLVITGDTVPPWRNEEKEKQTAKRDILLLADKLEIDPEALKEKNYKELNALKTELFEKYYPESLKPSPELDEVRAKILRPQMLEGIKSLAAQAGVNPNKYLRWGPGLKQMSARELLELKAFLEAVIEEKNKSMAPVSPGVRP